MAQTIDILQAYAQQMPEIAQGFSLKQPSGQRVGWSAHGDGGHVSDGSTGAGSGSSGRAAGSDASSSKDGDSDSERGSTSGGLSLELRRRPPAFFRPPPGLEAPAGAPAWCALGGAAAPAAAALAPAGGAPALAPARTALRSTARPFLSQGLAGAPRAAPAEEPAAAAPRGATAPTFSEPHAAEAEEAACSGESMRAHLQGLRGEGHRRTLVVRRIHRLGLDSPEKLRAHFEQYGAVEAVLVTHSHVRSERRSKQAVTTRIRPAHLGFVVMGGAEGAEAAVGDGDTHLVLGSPIQVQQFVPHHQEHAWAKRDNDEFPGARDLEESLKDEAPEAAQDTVKGCKLSACQEQAATESDPELCGDALADDEQDSTTESAPPSPRRAAAPQ